MPEFLNLKPEAFGLDISDLSLKIVKLKKRGKFFYLASLGEEKIPPGVIKGGKIKEEDKLAEIIKGALKKVKGEKLKTKHVVVSLPEEESFLQVIRMPKIPEDDVKSAVIYEAENYIPLPLEQVYLDSQVVLSISGNDYLDVLVVALPKAAVNSYLSCLKKAGLQPVAFEIESSAISRAIIKEQAAGSPVLIIDLGQTRTSFMIYYGNSLRFTSSIPISADGFTEIISKNLGVSLAEAEELKIKYGLEEKIKLEIKNDSSEIKEKGGKIFEALVPALVDLVQQIKKYLDYCQTHAYSGNLPAGGRSTSEILLCGGGANLKGLAELLGMELKIPVKLGNPWVNILPPSKKEVPKLSLEKSLGYTTVLGLALRGVRDENKS